MKNLILSALLLICCFSFAQNDGRTLLRGKVLYKNSNVANENVINVTSEKATVTNANGEFEIYVKSGDVLAFSAVNYRFTTVNITEGIIRNNRLVVEVTEKVEQLDEVVVSPENEKKFIELKEEEFKQVVYDQDESTRVDNLALTGPDRPLQYGLNFVNIFKAIFKSKKEKEPDFQDKLKVSEVLRLVYEDSFFTNNLNIPQDKIDEFLYYCDEKLPAEELLKKDNEFELIDFLVNQSKDYLNQVKSGN